MASEDRRLIFFSLFFYSNIRDIDWIQNMFISRQIFSTCKEVKIRKHIYFCFILLFYYSACNESIFCHIMEFQKNVEKSFLTLKGFLSHSCGTINGKTFVSDVRLHFQYRQSTYVLTHLPKVTLSKLIFLHGITF